LRDTWKKIAGLGLIGMQTPVEDGGVGADAVTEGLSIWEMGKYDPNMALAMHCVAELGSFVLNLGGKKVKDDFLRPMIVGDLVPSFALTEPGNGTDSVAMTTNAVKKGSKYVINGEKSEFTMAKAADFMVVFAKTDMNKGAKGVSVFSVPTNYPGITRQFYEDMGCKCLTRGSAFFNDVEVPEEYLIGKEGDGFIMCMRAFDISRIYIALLCLGAASKALEDAIEHCKQRRTFGSLLGSWEGVSFPIVEHISMLEAVRMLCFKGLWLYDQGKPSTKEAAMVKWMAPKIAAGALLTFGHYGYTVEYTIEQKLRDVIGNETADGIAQVCKIVLVRELLGRECLPYANIRQRESFFKQ
jgi:cyclohexanecarboxyl-CoA dehydrogenase